MARRKVFACLLQTIQGPNLTRVMDGMMEACMKGGIEACYSSVSCACALLGALDELSQGRGIQPEQFLQMVNPELGVWIQERDPKTAEDATRLAEVFLSARSGSRRATLGRDRSFTTRSSASPQTTGRLESRN
ncbi:uncharacterized protein KZ484_011498 isoform 2-T3 [Pholidichthys leucotaenia]